MTGLNAMASNYETFFNLDRFAVVGRSAAQPFPILSYRGLKRLGKTVFAVDPSAETVDGDRAYGSLDALPKPPEAVILEVPKAETSDWVTAAADAGVRDVWVHMGLETPEAMEAAEARGINLRSGTCAVMYLKPGLSYHSIHKAIMKAVGKY